MHTPTASWFDIGANLGHSSFADDLDAVLRRAEALGVRQLCITGTSLDMSARAAEIAEQHPRLLATAGVHPHSAGEYDADSNAALHRLLRRECVRAVGETGLDYHRNYASRPEQLRAFTGQLSLAADLNMPVFLHQREAHEDFIALVGEHRGAIPRAVAHCFTGTAAELEDCLDLDLYIGITGWICDERRGLHLHELIGRIPADRLLLETDCPYLLPRDLDPKPQNRRNEPGHLVHIGTVVARLLEVSPEQLAVQTRSNAETFFAAN
ncbi:MAG: TatD family hydrolase [Gammaproteobacteria bacterium AqS3]|nr:TatD family hydrolase [Gammaproteobacteria bacterium AqS3]